MGGSIAPVPAALLQKQPESPPQQHISNDGLQQVLSERGIMNAVLEEYVKIQPLATFHFQGVVAARYCGLMRECWQRDPRARPLFPQIIGKLEGMARRLL